MPNTPGTVAFPTALDDAVSLLGAKNRATTTLNGGIDNSVTTITLTDASGFADAGAITIDNERIYYAAKSGNDLTSCIRGVDGSSAASHSNAATVDQRVIAGYHDVIRAAVVAVQTKLGITSSTPTSGTVLTGTGTGTSEWQTPAGGGLTVGTTAIASGTAGRILYEASGNVLGEAAGITYQTGASPSTTITAQNASYVGLRVNSAATPSANIAEFTINGSTGAYIDNGGALATTNNSGNRALYDTSSTTTGMRWFNGSLFYHSGTETVWMTSANSGGFSSASLRVNGSGGLGFHSTTATTTFDTFFTRDSAATFQLGADSATPTDYTIKGADGSGTNIAGADFTLAGGKGTGTGAGGSVIVQVAPAGASGSSLNTLVTALQVDADTTAGNTRLLIYDVDNATLERVSVGAADSGGSGFKVLRIPN